MESVFMVFSIKSFTVLAITLFHGACSPEPDPTLEPTSSAVRDSAEVAIIESSAPAWGEGQGWKLTEEPILSIGAVDGSEEYLLYHSSSAIRLDDGRIVLSNGGSQEIRFYDTLGAYLSASGSNGEGPGEFRAVGFIWRLGTDSLAVLDFDLLRISVFDTEGVFGRIIRLGEGATDLVFPSGMFGDGSILALASQEDDGSYDSGLGSFRDKVQHRRYGREGKLLNTLVTLDGSELYRAVRPDGSGVTTGPQYALRAWSVAGADSWYYGSSATFEVQEWSMDGELRRVIRLMKEPRAIPPEVVADWENRLQRMRPQTREFWAPIPLPERLPAYEQIVLDRDENLWLAEYVVLEETPVWQVISPDGHWLGSVAMPPGGRISEIGKDYVLGTWRDELDVEKVRMYGLEKPAGG